ncbi:MAG: DUF6067 family protein [Verrucomicrobiae bacterium]|nr:DUF6067 family protein [Verrucomicrobiae bacterium]
MKKLLSFLFAAALSLPELWAQPSSAGDDILVGCWNFDRIEAGVIPDNSGKHHPLKMNDTLRETPGRFNSGLAFDGKKSWLDLDKINLENDFTISFWLKTSDLSKTQTLFSSGDEPNTLHININHNDEGNIVVFMPGLTVATTTKVLSVNEWHHFCYKRSHVANTDTLYLNGQQLSLIDNKHTPFLKAKGHRFLGKRNQGNETPFLGAIDELRIYQRTLTSREVAELANGYKRNDLEIQGISFGKRLIGKDEAVLEFKNNGDSDVMVSTTLKMTKAGACISPSTNTTLSVPAHSAATVNLSYRISGKCLPDMLQLDIVNPSSKEATVIYEAAGVQDLAKSLENAGEKAGSLQKTLDSLSAGTSQWPHLEWIHNYQKSAKGTIQGVRDSITTIRSQINVAERQGEWVSAQKRIDKNITKHLKEIERSARNLKNIRHSLDLMASKTPGIASRPFIASFARFPEKWSKDDVWKESLRIETDISAARNEYECLEFAIVPAAGEIRGLNSTATDLIPEQAGGEPIPAQNISIRRVGYIYSRKNEHWHPDPLLKNRPLNLKAVETPLATMWVTVCVPENARPGIYAGSIIVESESPKHRQELKIRLKVRPFSLPKTFTYPVVTSAELYWLSYFFYGSSDREAQLCDTEACQHPTRFISADEYRDCLIKPLLRYRLTPRPHDYGKDGLTDTPYCLHEKYKGPGDIDFKQFDATLKAIREGGAQYVQLGQSFDAVFERFPLIMSHFPPLQEWLPVFHRHVRAISSDSKMFVYGFDEPEDDRYPDLLGNVKEIDKLAPGCKTLLTFCNGTNNFVRLSKEVKRKVIWVLLNRTFMEQYKDLINQLIKEGEVIWGYDSNGPTYHISSPAIAHRIDFWSQKKYNLQGFLIWGSVSYWDGGINDIAEDGSLRPSWELGRLDGDGYLFYPGGKRLRDGLDPSIRLELIREGIEDREYFNLLEQKIEALQKLDDSRLAPLIEECKKAATIEDSIVKTHCVYTRNFGVLYQRRDQIAQKIEEADQVLNKARPHSPLPQ